MLSIDIFSLFLLIYTADHLHPMFVGAMCAAGTFNVNGYGYPALIIKAISVVTCGVWLIVNQADTLAEDYPLIKVKYGLLPAITVIIVLGAALLIAYLKGLDARVITSCCGTLFSTDAPTVAGSMSSLPVSPTRILFFVCAALHARAALHLLATGRAGGLLGWISGVYAIIALVSVIVFISVYYYELPTHHCPFDILQAHYHYIGYPLYASLFGFAVTGIGIGVLQCFTGIPSLAATLPTLQRRYAWISLFANLLFVLMAIYPMLFSDFTLNAG
jgi:hypothetical protein